MKNEMIPILIRQLGENVLDKRTGENLRFNSLTTLERIRDYCDMIIKKARQ